MRKLRDRLTNGDDLSRFDIGRCDHAIRIGLEIGIGELVAGEIERAASAGETAIGFIVGRFLSRSSATAANPRAFNVV